jgi:hypothetical protein
MWWKIGWSLLRGNLAGIFTAVSGLLGKLSDNDAAKFATAAGADKEVAIAQLTTSAQVWHDRVDLLKGLKITSWLIGAALIPPIYHQALIYFDSCPFFLIPYFWHVQGSWKVAEAPGIYAEREGILIMALLGIQGGIGVGIGAIKALARR